MDLARIPGNVDTVVFVITSYSEQRFTQIENAYARVVDVSGPENEVVRYDLGRDQDVDNDEWLIFDSDAID